ncbi:RAD55 family ATPase [Halapricum desulfuricans]
MATNTDHTGTMYDLTSVLDVDALASVRPGSTILISGPAMTGKEALAYDLLTDGVRQNEGAVIVSTGDRADSVIGDFSERTGRESFPLGVIDCVSDRSGGETTDDGVYAHHVSSPGDLTGIGIGITKALEGLHESGVEKGRLALASLSTMLTYTDRKTVFKFCHVLSSRLDSAGYLGLFTIDSGAHDDQTLQVIKQAFDGMIEIRERDGTREARVVGLTSSPSDWQTLE